MIVIAILGILAGAIAPNMFGGEANDIMRHQFMTSCLTEHELTADDCEENSLRLYPLEEQQFNNSNVIVVE
jgi:hypothetical protein